MMAECHWWCAEYGMHRDTPVCVLWLVFDTGLTVTPLMGHLGCLASHWSVPVMACVCIIIIVELPSIVVLPVHTMAGHGVCVVT